MNAALLKQIQAKRDEKNVYQETNTKQPETSGNSPKPAPPKKAPPPQSNIVNIPYTPDANDIVVPDEDYYAELGPNDEDIEAYNEYSYDGDMMQTNDGTTPNPDIEIEIMKSTTKKGKKSKKPTKSNKSKKKRKESKDSTKKSKSKKSKKKKSAHDPQTAGITATKSQSESETEEENNTKLSVDEGNETTKKRRKKSKDSQVDDGKKRRKKSKDKQSKKDHEDMDTNEETPRSPDTKIRKPFILKQEDVNNAMKTTYRVGTICRIHSMEKQKQYNNKFCRVLGYKKSQKGGKIDVYYVKILNRFKKTYFFKANVLKVENMSDLSEIKERKCVLCSCFVFLAILAVMFIAGAIWCYFFYNNEGVYYYVCIGSGAIGVLLIFASIFSYLKERFCFCCCNCCYVR